MCWQNYYNSCQMEPEPGSVIGFANLGSDQDQIFCSNDFAMIFHIDFFRNERPPCFHKTSLSYRSDPFINMLPRLSYESRMITVSFSKTPQIVNGTNSNLGNCGGRMMHAPQLGRCDASRIASDLYFALAKQLHNSHLEKTKIFSRQPQIGHLQ